MAIETLVNTKRGGNPVPTLQNVPVRIKETTMMVQSGEGGAVPYNLITLYSRVGIPDFRTGDQLTATDGSTYRASGVPVVHDQSYLSIQLTRFTETTP